MKPVVPQISTGPVAGRLTGKVAFITGTAGGQGRAVALLFARAGAVVFGADLKASEVANAETLRLACSEHLTFFAATVDVAEEGPVRQWIDDGVAQMGRIDILYNNAGFAHFEPVEQLTQAHWTETLKYELDVVFNPTRFAWPHMKRQRGGLIINVASVAGMIGTPILPAVAHAAGKGGVIGVTKQYAVEGANDGIRVNSISPGGIWTPATRGAITTSNPYFEFFENMAALHRVGEPEDVAYAALFLASDEAAWITGINLMVDGGYGAKGGARA